MREWCLLLETATSEAGRTLESALRESFDVDRDRELVYCFCGDESDIEGLRKRVLRVLEAENLREVLLDEPAVRRWNEGRHRYVDPDNAYEPLDDD